MKVALCGNRTVPFGMQLFKAIQTSSAIAMHFWVDVFRAPRKGGICGLVPWRVNASVKRRVDVDSKMLQLNASSNSSCSFISKNGGKMEKHGNKLFVLVGCCLLVDFSQVANFFLHMWLFSSSTGNLPQKGTDWDTRTEAISTLRASKNRAISKGKVGRVPEIYTPT